MRSLRSKYKTTKPLTSLEFKRRYVFPVFRRLARQRVYCEKYGGECCPACCRNDVLNAGISRFVRIYDHSCGLECVHCVVGDYVALRPLLQREFARSGVAFAETLSKFVFRLRRMQSPHALWQRVRALARALAFASWLKKLVAEREWHPSRIDFAALTTELDADITSLRA